MLFSEKTKLHFIFSLLNSLEDASREIYILPGQFSPLFPLTNVFGHSDYEPVSELNMIGLHW